jgi:hypothetical protein
MVEFIMSHDGKNWIAKNDFLYAEAPTLEQLDAEVQKVLRKKGYIEKGKQLAVFMAFDNSTIPQWMRQYGQHYFNRIVRLEG